MARHKLWTLVLFCLALSGSPTIGTAAPKQSPAAANAIRVTYSLAANQTSPSIELPPNVPVSVMVTQTTFGSAALAQMYMTSFTPPNVAGIFWTGFDYMFLDTSLPPARVFGLTASAGAIIVRLSDCTDLVVASATAIAVRNKDLDSDFQICVQQTGTVTIIY